MSTSDSRGRRAPLTRRQFLAIAVAGASVAGASIPSFGDSGPGAGGGQMQYRTLGRTGQKVSLVGIGGAHLGFPGEAESIRIVRTAVDNGVNFMDNCWDYGGGTCEERMGKALR